MKFEYKIILHNGETVSVVAESRKGAINAYCRETGMQKDFFNAHCSIKNMGKVKCK